MWIVEINPYERMAVVAALDTIWSCMLIQEELMVAVDIQYPDMPDEDDEDEEDTVFQQANRQGADSLATLNDVIKKKTQERDLARMDCLDVLR